MDKCIESILEGADYASDIEIIVVDDGSTKDETPQKADEWAERYPDIIRAHHQENGGHGTAVLSGLKKATGTFYKVVDSDDWVDTEALAQMLDKMRATEAAGADVDLFITNYVYDHLASKSNRTMQYRSFFPADKVFTWPEMGRTGLDKFIMIHAAWYKTSILRESGVHLHEGVSYMDSMLLLHPMPYVKTLFYLDIAPYHYLIGREGQSVEIDVVKKHIDEQILASRLAIDDVDYTQLYETEPNCAMLMMGYVSCMMSTSTAHLFMINTPEAFQKNDELWAFLEAQNPVLYDNVCRSWAGKANRKTALGRLLARGGYTVAKKIYKFA